MAAYSVHTLESHLNDCANNNKEFEQLHSIWTLNKKNILNAQNSINYNFPHYSLHESSHSSTIIKNIESFLGESRIQQLTPTDTWLILMAAFTHDLGMVVFNNVLEKQWIDEKFQEYLVDLSNKSTDKDLQKSAKLIIDVNNKEFDSTLLNLPIKIRRAVTLVIADFFRRNHHYRSREIISGIDSEFYDYLNGFNFSGIPNRFINILAEIAYCHGIDFYEVIDRIEYKSNGFSGDNMHPRFVAFLLRLGDLLDVDDKRFNIFSEKVFGDSLPYTSQLHKEKHASVKHLLISPNNIEVTVDCQNDEIYRITRGWFDWLQSEVENQAKEWTNIAPLELSGIPPIISRGKIKILYKSVEPKKELMNLRFEISNSKVFEMFEGSAIYEKVGVVFLREIVQNSLDASKLQMWKFITSGVFDNSIIKHLNVSKKTPHEELIKLIKFPSDIPKELWENFIITLKINRIRDGVLNIEIRDFGTGISETDLIRMMKKVGESRSSNEEYQRMKKEMPSWLKPTGAFGIGLQSLFIINESFVIQTKADLEPAKEITFYSAKNGEYCRITNSDFEMSRGTKLTIEVQESNLSEMFENSFSMDIVNSYDVFSDTYGNIFIHKLVAHIQSEFKYIDTLNVEVFNENIKAASLLQSDEEEEKITFKDEDMAILLYKSEGTNYLVNIFDVYEDAGVGGQYIIWFYPSFGEDSMNRHTTGSHHNQYLVRDIPVGNKGINYYLFEYLRLVWNFQSQDTDKILNISRDKFINSTKEIITRSFFKEIFPKIMYNIANMYENHVSELDESAIIQYFHLHITALMSGVKPINSAKVYGDNLMPKDLVTDGNCTQIRYIDFFNANRILVLKNNPQELGKLGEETLMRTYEEFSKAHNTQCDMIMWSYSYLRYYIKLTDFYKVEYLIYEYEGTILSLDVYKKEPDYDKIVLNEKSYMAVLKTLADHRDRHSNARTILPPLEEYWKDLSVNKEFRSFYNDNKGLNHFIISPFNNNKDSVEAILAMILAMKNEDEKIESILQRNYLDRLVTDTLVKFIIANNPNPLYKRDESSIKNSYSKLIIEFFKKCDSAYLSELEDIYTGKVESNYVDDF